MVFVPVYWYLTVTSKEILFFFFFVWQEFNYGVEFVLLISFVDNAFGGPVQHALASLARLTYGFPSLIVQSTQGVFEVKLITCYAA